VNRGVHACLIETLLENGSQAGAALLPFLSDVQLPEDFPGLTIPAAIPEPGIRKTPYCAAAPGRQVLHQRSDL